MKRIIVLSSPMESSYTKYNIIFYLNKLGLKIKNRCSSYLILEQDIQIIFKTINPKRPADFYKYLDSDIFVTRKYLRNQNLNEDKLKFINDFLFSLKKKRTIVFYDSEDDFIKCLPIETKPYWLIVGPCLKNPIIQKKETPLNELPQNAYWSENEASENLIKIFENRINQHKENILYAQREIESLTKTIAIYEDKIKQLKDKT